MRKELERWREDLEALAVEDIPMRDMPFVLVPWSRPPLELPAAESRYRPRIR